jgi:exopolyphosphatase / guanosine-5'-triphosphate,3'-diphosphate pyrophosphatase
MKCASIDIGTNTVLLAVADVGDGILTDIADLAVITRLGEGLKATGLLGDEAMERTFLVLKDYRETALRRGAEEIYCVGTAALREAGNSTAFIERVKGELGISIRVISGRDEAYYTYLSVKHDGFPGMEEFIIFDIGGGSTEIIEGSASRFVDFVSLPVGSVKLTEMFVRSDPPTGDEIARLVAFLKDTIHTPFEGAHHRIVGTAGTVTNIAAIALGLERYEKPRIHGLSVGAGEIDAIIGRLKSMTVRERRGVRGMEAGREDILLQGTILMREIMTCFDAGELLVSANGVRYGVLYEKMEREAT